MDDYIKTFKKFAAVSSNTMEFETLSSDLLDFFSQIPDAKVSSTGNVCIEVIGNKAKNKKGWIYYC